jgi:hypothetical protein
MGVSDKHIFLVKSMSTWIVTNFLANDEGYILIDLPSSPVIHKPPTVNGFIPDLFVPRTQSGTTIVGEAKTSSDLERRHSFEQISAFMVFCETHMPSLFVLAVPWHSVPQGRSLIRHIIGKEGLVSIQVQILENLPG